MIRIPVPLAALAALAASALAADAHAFCVRNDLKDRNVFATVLAPTNMPKPAKVYSELVAPGKESCCNPRNTECNPSRLPHEGQLSLDPYKTPQILLAFEARVEAKLPPPGAARVAPAGNTAQVVACGRPTTDKRFASGVEAPIPTRSYLRFEANPAFNPQQKYGWENPPFLLKVFVGTDNRLVATFPCPPRQTDKPGRIDFLK